MSATIYEAPRAIAEPGETIITSTCGHNCGGRCVVNAHVSDGRIVHISTDARRWHPDHPPLPACARGVGQIERTYHPDRLKHPMRRVGPRGSGRFERDRLGRSAGHRGERDAANSAYLRQRLDPRCFPHRQSVGAAWPRGGAAVPLHVRRLHRSVVQHVGRSRSVLGPHHLWRKGLQIGRSRTDGFRQFQVDSDVGLEPWGRHLRYRNHAVSEMGETERHADRLRRPTGDDDQPPVGRRACLHSPVHRRRGTDRHGLRHRLREPARPGLLRSLRARL